MIYVALPDTFPLMRLPFYLAMEEWVARSLPPAEYFFAWSSDPTVIFGRNQDMRSEVNLEYCRQNGIQCYRRKSGGGCVYSDRDNLMTSYIAPTTCVTSTFARYTSLLVSAMRSLGVDASATGRNDVVIDGRKVSGCAFYHLPDRSIAHGTLLYHIDMERMLNAITPAKSKLQSHRVQSVEARITSLGDYLPGMPLEEFRRHLISHVTDQQLVLNDEQIAEILDLEVQYYRRGWNEGSTHRSRKRGMQISRHIEGCGNLKASLWLDTDGCIENVDLTGDYFLLSDLDSQLLDLIKGIKPADVTQALQHTDASKVIANLSTADFASLISQAVTLHQS